MVSLETETDRTLFFDLLPIDVGQVAGFSTRIQLYTVPGQVFYNTTRKLVLKGVDGVVFVADSQRAMLDANVQSFKNLEENLAEMGLSTDELPLVLQYNKRDLADICSVEELDETLNRRGWPCFEAVAIHGEGVFETLRGVSRETLLSLRQRLTSGPAETKPAAKRSAPAGAAGRSGTAAPAAPARSAPPAKAAAQAPPAARRPDATRPAATRPEAARAATVQQAGPPPRPPDEDTASGTTAAGERPLRRTVDVDGELARLRREALRPGGGAPAAARSAAPSGNGKRELSRDIKLTLKRPDFERARRFTLSFQVEDADHRVVDSVRGLQVDLGSPGEIAKVLLRLNIALHAKE
jgi:signal recognition particle receptor subunit beta